MIGIWVVGYFIKMGIKLEYVLVLFVFVSILGVGMYIVICDEFGIEFFIFVFIYCCDVVVVVSKVGGFGVFGVVGFMLE